LFTKGDGFFVLKRNLILIFLFASSIWVSEVYAVTMPSENPMPDKLYVPLEFLNVRIPDKLPSANYDIDMPKLSDFEGARDFLANETANGIPLEYLSKINSLLEDKLFIWPVVGGKISSSYGFRLGGAQGRIHHGVDIPMPSGTPIVAARDGVVKRADSVLRGYGNLIILDHGKGVETRYAHCSAFEKKEGDTVSAGEVIAYVGSSGNSTANHLHFEILINGLAYNPMRFFSENQLVYGRQFNKK
jgi:murein DD-endopeptidase MepM/ murein hydrolase activator NlpD